MVLKSEKQVLNGLSKSPPYLRKEYSGASLINLNSEEAYGQYNTHNPERVIVNLSYKSLRGLPVQELHQNPSEKEVSAQSSGFKTSEKKIQPEMAFSGDDDQFNSEMAELVQRTQQVINLNQNMILNVDQMYVSGDRDRAESPKF